MKFKLSHIFQALVRLELNHARAKHGPMSSEHEAFAVIFEEVDEFWQEVKKKPAKRDQRRMLDELVQVAAMAQRAAEDLGLIKPLNPLAPARPPSSMKAR